jgi:hypothetical protein
MGQMEMEFTQFMVQLGVGGALAGMLFWFYRRDVQRITDHWNRQSDHLMQVVISNTSASTQHAEVLRAHTAAVTSNTEVLRALHNELTINRREEHRK